jgi:ArsR family transcriptional regulator, arsenate/arsenite/antimonite-responsive transcriptional repressor
MLRKGISVIVKDRVAPGRGTAMDTKRIENIAKALADETRLRIFEAIACQDDLTCGDLARLQGVTPATISHHLKILRQAELIECRKEGQFVYSRMVPETIVVYTESLALLSNGIRATRSARKE